MNPPGHHPQNIGSDILGVRGNDWVRSFDEAYVPFLILFPLDRLHDVTEPSASRQSDMDNERLPKSDPVSSRDSLVIAPSMRQENTEELIRKALKDEEGNSAVERLADRIARVRVSQGQPRAPKRSERP